jgi:hypothetical protein
VGVLKFEYHKDGRHLTMSDPTLSDLKCPGCKIEIKAKVRYQDTRGFPQFSASGTMRASARLEARVTMDGPRLQKAQVLVKDLKVVGLNLNGVNNAIDAEIRKQMDQKLPNQLPPVDVTALVQTFLNQGGSFTAAPSSGRAAGSLKRGGESPLGGPAPAGPRNGLRQQPEDAPRIAPSNGVAPGTNVRRGGTPILSGAAAPAANPGRAGPERMSAGLPIWARASQICRSKSRPTWARVRSRLPALRKTPGRSRPPIRRRAGSWSFKFPTPTC